MVIMVILTIVTRMSRISEFFQIFLPLSVNLDKIQDPEQEGILNAGIACGALYRR